MPALMVLHEKHGDRYVACDPDIESAARHVVRGRLETGEFYDAATAERARMRLSDSVKHSADPHRGGAAYRFLRGRATSYEYENLTIAHAETPVDPVQNTAIEKHARTEHAG